MGKMEEENKEMRSKVVEDKEGGGDGDEGRRGGEEEGRK